MRGFCILLIVGGVVMYCLGYNDPVQVAHAKQYNLVLAEGR